MMFTKILLASTLIFMLSKVAKIESKDCVQQQTAADVKSKSCQIKGKSKQTLQ